MLGRFSHGSVVAACLVVAAGHLNLHAQLAPYRTHEELTVELRSLVDGTDLATLQSLATSPAGREVWLVELAASGAVPAEERPGVLVVANLEGDHLVGSYHAVEMIRFLLAEGEAQASALAENVFYIIPRLNPDGAEAMFGPVVAARTTNARPVDDDNDGRIDEDPPEDLNGDGFVTVMRVRDSLGTYVSADDDPRLMAEADAGLGRAGAYRVHWEGVDSDGDGFLNEDGPGGVDLNRNFQHEYPYYTRDSGPHMVSEPESRGLMDFVLAHRNIAAILTFGHSDNLVVTPDSGGELAPPATLSLSGFADASNEEAFDVGIYSSGSPVGGLDLRGTQPGADNDPDSGERPATEVNEADLEYFEAVSDAYRDATGIERVGVNRAAEGAFFQYGYYQFGVPSFTTQGWGLVEDESGEEEDEDPASDDEIEPGIGAAGSDAELLEALDGRVPAFLDWETVQHPDLGEVEIGGFHPYAATNPPPDELPALAASHAEFLLDLAELLPHVTVASSEVESHGGGLYTVTVEVENGGFFPTALRHGVRSGSVDPVTVRIGIDREDLVTGDALTSVIDQLMGSGTRERFSWLIRGEDGQAVEVRVRSQKGGSDAITLTLGEG